MKGGANLPAEDPSPANLDDGELSSNQEATPVPWGAGEIMVSAIQFCEWLATEAVLRPLSPPAGMRAQAGAWLRR